MRNTLAPPGLRYCGVTMMDCPFIPHESARGVFVCPDCKEPTPAGRTYQKPPRRNCPNAPDLIPIAERLAEETGDRTILNKVAHCGVALLHWSFGGFQTRSKEEVQRIYTEHCRPCEYFDAVADACKICGCNVRAEGMAIRNKIAMATEKCPKGKW